MTKNRLMKNITDRMKEDARTSLTDNEVKILLFLCDEAGHSGDELVAILNQKKSNISVALKKLRSDHFGDFVDSISIRPHHLIDVNSILSTLAAKRGFVSRYIDNNMPNIFKEHFGSQDPEFLTFVLAMGLDHFLLDSELYDKRRFQDVKKSDRTRELLAKLENNNEKER